MMLIFLYISAVFCTRVIGNNSVYIGTPERDDIELWFGSVTASMCVARDGVVCHALTSSAHTTECCAVAISGSRSFRSSR